MDRNLLYLFVAFFVSWLVMGGYLWSLSRQVQNLRDEVEALESADVPTATQAGAVGETRAQTDPGQA
ncbi:MAG TPA: CcmD family protein [Thermomicrobiaceae bacterium]|nr:CcmD family protein [Thermomicrobiaceae bacterium]